MRPILAAVGLLLLVSVSGCSSSLHSGPSPNAQPTEATGAASTVPRTASHAFDKSGDPHCAITYHGAGTNMTTWTATTTVAGELVTRADHTGQPDHYDDPIPAGKHTYIAWAALTKLTALSGVLQVAGTQYPCSVAPAP